MERRQRTPGHKKWFIPDGYLPEDDPAKGGLITHESCCILNTNTIEANCSLTLYFEEGEPVRNIRLTVEPERCWHVRFDYLEKFTGVAIPRNKAYGLALTSDQNVVVQHTRFDSRSGYAYLSVVGYFED